MVVRFPKRPGMGASFAPERGPGKPKKTSQNALGLLRYLRGIRPDDSPDLTETELALRRRFIYLSEGHEDE